MFDFNDVKPFWIHPKDRKKDTGEAHALLGPSSATRWMACTRSARFGQQFPDRESPYANEGTDAHSLLEMTLNQEWATIEQFKRESFYYNGEMEEQVNRCVDAVMQEFSLQAYYDRSTILEAEQRFHFEEYVPEGFGTGDITIIGNGILKVMDLKYGKGVPVDAYDNSQLKIYGLGAWLKYRILYDIHTVELIILQPRLNNLSRFIISVNDLVHWAETQVKPKAQLAWNGQGEFLAGDHCKFCKGKDYCKTHAEYMLELENYKRVGDPNMLTPKDLAYILDRIDALVSWSHDVKDFALEQSLKYNTKIPGHKLVEGKSTRKLSSTDKVLEILINDGWSKDLLYKDPEAKSLTELEKLVGPTKFSQLMGSLMIKPQGKPTLVKESDPRPALNSLSHAQRAFNNY